MSTTVIPFSRYNEEFSSLQNQIRSTLSTITAALDNNPSDTTIESKMSHANNLLSQAKDLLKQMTIESRSIDDKDIKADCQKVVRVAKGNQANLVEDVKAVQNRVERQSLLRTSVDLEAGVSTGKNSAAREHLLKTNSALQSQNSTLDKARRVMAETEDVALEITEELSRNRETIESAHSRVRGVNILTNQARRVLMNMQRRDTQQRMIIYGIFVGMFIAVLFLFGFI
jgi:vesicle transport through interaction with t-SNAREs protein 1